MASDLILRRIESAYNESLREYNNYEYWEETQWDRISGAFSESDSEVAALRAQLAASERLAAARAVEVERCHEWARKALQAFEDARAGQMRGDWAVTDIESTAKQILAAQPDAAGAALLEAADAMADFLARVDGGGHIAMADAGQAVEAYRAARGVLAGRAE